MHTTTRGLVLLILTAWVGLGLAVPPASAHSRLLSSSPADGTTVPSSPGEIVLTFNEDINPQFVTVRVSDGEGGDVVGAEATVAGPKVTLPVAQPIAAGSYKITYRVVSADSHPISGSTAFTIAGDPLASPSPAASSSTPAPSSSTTTGPTATPDASSAPSAATAAGDQPGASGGTPIGVWLIVFGALAVAVGATFYAVRRERDGA